VNGAGWPSCRLLIQKPDILLLDEPTNHLDAALRGAGSSATSRSTPGTVIAVTHDRYFLDNVAGWILELDRGQGIPWKGNYSSWLEQKEERLRQEEKGERQRQKTLERELEWIRMAPRASTPRARRGSTPTRSCCGRNPRSWPASSRSSSRTDRGSAMSSSRRRA
jgi:sulfate-transporting ATPase